MSIFKIVKISPHSTGYKQIELIDESLFSATKEEQDKFAFSGVLPEAELQNLKEGDMIELILKPAS
jgi:hypothetical protein